jgi:hypothetical protein
MLARKVADAVLRNFPEPPPFNWGEGTLREIKGSDTNGTVICKFFIKKELAISCFQKYMVYRISQSRISPMPPKRTLSWRPILPIYPIAT